MRKRLSSVWIVAALAAAVPAALPPALATAGEAAGQTHTIRIRKLQFSPHELTVAPGDTVIWVNDDLVPHTATADDMSWDSAHLDSDGRWVFVVQAGMSEDYFCRYHPTMRAQLHVAPR